MDWPLIFAGWAADYHEHMWIYLLALFLWGVMLGMKLQKILHKNDALLERWGDEIGQLEWRIKGIKRRLQRRGK